MLLRVDGGPDAGTMVRAEGDAPVAVGASPDNQLVLHDPTVSRYHLEVSRSGDGITVADLGSRNGTYLGAVRIERVVVPPGTRLSLGSSSIVVDSADAITAPAEDEVADIPGLVARAAPMREVARLIRKLAPVRSSVLIEGETGVGKEVVARALHELGPYRDRPFVVVDCGSMPATLVASELFGHERGAFTGAQERRIGAFERADGGTVLLDELGELPLEVQPNLLGVLERRRFVRVGGSSEIDVDVRVLAATNRDLRAEVNQGRFRADLYYRLAVARVVIPPLRDRPGDIEPLVAHFAAELTGVPGQIPLSRDELQALRAHPFSGNVRELRNVVEGALVIGHLSLDGGAAEAANDGGASRAEAAADSIRPYREQRAATIKAFEYGYLKRLIEQCGGNASEAARRARMDRPYLLTLLRRHGLR